MRPNVRAPNILFINEPRHHIVCLVNSLSRMLKMNMFQRICSNEYVRKESVQDAQANFTHFKLLLHSESFTSEKLFTDETPSICSPLERFVRRSSYYEVRSPALQRPRKCTRGCTDSSRETLRIHWLPFVKTKFNHKIFLSPLCFSSMLHPVEFLKFQVFLKFSTNVKILKFF